MDLGTAIMTASPWLFIIGAVILGAIGWGYLKGIAKKGQEGIYKIGAIFMVLLLAANLGWVAIGQTHVAPKPTGTQSAYDVKVANSQSWVIQDSALSFRDKVAYNDTSNAFTGQTQYVQLNISVLRIAGTGDSKLQIEVSDPGHSPTNASAPKDSYDMIETGTDGDYEADFTASDGTVSTDRAVMAFSSDSTSDYVTLNLTCDNNAIQYMDELEQAPTTITLTDPAVGNIASITVTWQKVTITV